MWKDTQPIENKILLCWVYNRGEYEIDCGKAESCHSEPLPQYLYEGYCLAVYRRGKWHLYNGDMLSEYQIDVIAWQELPAPCGKVVHHEQH